MALRTLNVQDRPMGEFDAKDSQYLLFKGGEVCTWAGVSTTAGTDLAAADVVSDGYVGTSSKTRPAITFTLTSSSRPLFLADDGTANYGTLFGTVVGGVAGQVTTTGGTVLGPSTATGSGKVTIWGSPGYYATTLDAVDTAADGLVPTNASLAVGTALTYTATGQLTPVGSTNAVGSAPNVARLAEFQTNGSLVTTPQTLVAALNSPSGSVSSLQATSFYQATFWFGGSAV